jgi:16S rRNA (cytidine1402-2'-O)-methyltransferase
VSYHARSGPRRAAELLAHLRAGDDLALVTDAGTPGVSDPGDALVSAWAAEGGEVVPLPGASAVLAAVSGSGLAGPRWAFEGFLPRSGRERRERLAAIAADSRGSVVFEAANRLAGTLRDLIAVAGPDRPAAVCRELTKLHEQIVRGPLEELARHMEDGTIPPRGEVVIVVGWDPGVAVARSTPDATTVAAARAEVDALVDGGLGRAAAARQVAASSGIPRRRLYGEPARNATKRE